MAALAEATRGRWFTDGFRAAHPDEVDRLIAMLTAPRPEGYAGCCEALAGFDVRRALAADRRARPGSSPATQDPVAPPDAVPGDGRRRSRAPTSSCSPARRTSRPSSSPDAFDAAVTEHLERHL